MRFLAHFSSAADLEVFRRHELAAVCETLGVKGWALDEVDSPPQHPEPLSINFEGSDKPFVFNERQPMFLCGITLPTVDSAVAVASRCVLLKCIYCCFAEGDTLENMLAAAERRRQEEPTTSSTGDPLPPLQPSPFAYPAAALIHSQQTADCGSDWVPRLRPLLASSVTFRYAVDTICRSTSSADRSRIVNTAIDRVGHQGAVEIADPACEFTVVLVYRYSTLEPPKDVAWPMAGAYLCVPIAKSGRQSLLDTYNLKKRPYIGTTSMPAELTFLMANLGKVVRGSVCYDPFCGTGSLLVSCSHHGGFVMGSDMDGCAMRGGTVKFKRSQQILHQQKLALQHYLPRCLASAGGTLTDEEAAHPDMVTNFKIYNLPHPDRIRLNFSLWFRCFAGTVEGALSASTAATATAHAEVPRPRFLMDCIMSDPPYGVREQKKRVACEVEEGAASPTPNSSNTTVGVKHTVENEESYDISAMVTELLLFAGAHLRVGGRLVFWLPTTYLYTPDEIPVHPFLKLVLAEVQTLTLKMNRVLVVMERTETPQVIADRSTPSTIDAVTRDLIKPAAATSSLRALLDQSKLDDNEAFMGYKRRKNEKRERIRAFWEAEEEKRRLAEGRMENDGPKLSADELYKKYKQKSQVTAERIVENRKKKEAERRLPHQQVHPPKSSNTPE